ncbi:MAG: molybdopterin cofactor-binding domain-containing protein [Pseudomonadales bacterium]
MTSINRRQFVKGSTTVAGGFALGFGLTGCAQPPYPATKTGAFQPNAFIQIAPDNSIIFQVFRAEVGQGVSTALPMILAEELEVDPALIQVEMSGVHPAYNDPQYNVMITGGSASIAGAWDILREAGAITRQALVNAAAIQWGVSSSECRAVSGQVVAESIGKRLNYGELADAARKLPLPTQVALKPAADFKVIGTEVNRLDLLDKVTGKTQYSMDINIAGGAEQVNEPEEHATKVAVVVRNPELGGGVAAFNAAAALEQTGVSEVFEIPAGVAVVADSYWHARKAADNLQVEWQAGSLAQFSTAAMRQRMDKLMSSDAGKNVRDDKQSATLDPAITKALEAEYYVPHLAHGQLEPSNCLIWFREEHGEAVCDMWLPNQGPDLCQKRAAQLLGLPLERVNIHSTWVGSSFGRRLNQDHLEEAAYIALGMKTAQPLRLMWSREDDTRHDFYRPAMLARLRAELSADDVWRWQHKLVGPSISQQQIPLTIKSIAPTWVPELLPDLVGKVMAKKDFSSLEGSVDMPYQIANIKVDYALLETDVPIGYWRSVGHSHSGFVVESFIDEVAHALGHDSIEFRRQRLQQHPRHLAVLQLVAEKAAWGQSLPAGRFHGVAVHEAFDTVVAEVAEVSVHEKEIRVHKVTAAVHCGQVINPLIVKQQIESGILVALAQTLYSEITFDKGQVQQSNFHDYRVVRMNESPEIEVHIVPSTAAPTGVGEPGTPPLAPAVANAVFASTGQRLRSLPLRLA